MPVQPLRILFVGEQWQGSDSYAYARALRRAGHSVTILDEATFMPTGWQSPWLKALRRMLEPRIVAEYERALVAAARHLRPHLLLSFKGPYVTARSVALISGMGAVAINVYPDVSFMSHGPRLPKALPLYDWVFTTKSFGLVDMERRLGIRDASFIPPAFDPEVHAPIALGGSDRRRYGSDLSFIGTWSMKKEAALARLRAVLPAARLRIWGSHWERSTADSLKGCIERQVVTGAEYAKCIGASRINLGLLSEMGEGASSGDLVTARTFQIPAAGGFMLHERTAEVGQYFAEGRECALFSTAEEMAETARYYLDHEAERRQIAEAGRARALASGYGVDERVADVIAKYHEIAARRATLQASA